MGTETHMHGPRGVIEQDHGPLGSKRCLVGCRDRRGGMVRDHL